MDERNASPPRVRCTRYRGCALCLILVVWSGWWLFNQVSKARESARDLQCQSCLNQIAFALYCYHDTYEAFPPAVVADERGTPLYSWRVLLLPWLGFTELYDEFDLNASWDSPQNMRLAARTPPYFRCPSGLSAGDVQFTNYVVISGPGTAFPGTWYGVSRNTVHFGLGFPGRRGADHPPGGNCQLDDSPDGAARPGCGGDELRDQ